MVEVLSHFLGGGDNVTLGDPLHQVLHLAAEQEVVVGVVQLLPAVLGQLLQARILLVHLTLSADDRLAADRNIQGESQEAS